MEAQVSTHTIDLGGTTVCYLEAGREYRPAAPAIVFVHGLGSGSGSWTQTMENLGQDYWCVAPDLVGFADTPPPPDFAGYTPQAVVQYLRQFLEAIQVTEACIVGWSLGGAVSLHAVLDAPDRYRGLVLVSSAGIDRHVHWMLRLYGLPFVGEWMLSRASGEDVEKSQGFLAVEKSRIPQEFLDYHVRLAENPWHVKSTLAVLRDNGIAFWGQRRSMVRDRLGEIDLPTLIIWGDADPLIPVAHASVAEQRLPNSQVEIFEHCGHLPPVEYPDRFNRRLRRFIKEHVSP